MYSNRVIYCILKNSNSLLKRNFVLSCNKYSTAYKTAINNGGFASRSDGDHVKPVFRCANEHANSIAVHDINGEFTYKSLFTSSVNLSKEISNYLGNKNNERVAFLCPNDASYIITQWATWISGQTVVPLSKLHPPNLLEYYITDSCSKLLITTSEYTELLTNLSNKCNAKLLILKDDLLDGIKLHHDKRSEHQVHADPEPTPILDAGLDPHFYHNTPAMIIYTSGTTGPPKGVVLTHDNICAQVSSMISAWEWNNKDVILHCLPLHHVHGIVNGLLTPLSVGAKCIMLPHFTANDVWTHLMAIKKQPNDRISIFTGVPTMYVKLIEEFDKLFDNNKRQSDFIRATLSQKIRLMISGSAPLPSTVLERWKEISGHTILERYGMTETGMVLSNPVRGERLPSCVGTPMPSVQVRVTSRAEPPEILVEGSADGTRVISPPKDGKSVSGELLVRGPTVFSQYWNKPKATEKTFTPDGWFKTGDTVEVKDNNYYILGRTSVDIIKSGGFKVSALQVERELLTHEAIQDVAVVGVSDVTWGEKVAAVVVLHKDKLLNISQLRDWCRNKLPSYSIPVQLQIVKQIPRNAMGKINKKELVRDLFTNSNQK